MTDLIVAYCEPWDTPLRTSKHHYIERLADAGWRVLYLEVPANPASVFRHRASFFEETLPRIRAGLRTVRPNVWALSGFVPLPYHRALGPVSDRLAVNAINQRSYLPKLRHALASLGFANPVVLSYYPFILPILDRLAPSRVLFHMVDEWQGLTGIPRSMATLTQQMLHRADVTVVTAQRLYDRYADGARDIRLLRHGTDLSLFAPVVRGEVQPDAEIASLDAPVIGYYGALQKLDFALVEAVARARPAWSFVLIGPPVANRSLGQRGSLPANVHFFGARARETLPSVLAGLDAFWMPFVINELHNSMCPIKLYEALSAGTPVVSSDLHEVRAAAGDEIALADTFEGHLAALDAAIVNKDSDGMIARLNSVVDMDWSDRLRIFEALLSGIPAQAREEQALDSIGPSA